MRFSMNTNNSSSCPAKGAELAAAPSRHPAPAAPVVNVYLTGCNIQQGEGIQYIAGADSRALADTIKAQAATIAAQQRIIDRLLSILEGQPLHARPRRA